jgi:acetyl-CoA C-acetyltransferase
MGDGTVVDSLIKDGLWDVYNNFHMGAAAELCAERYGISRAEQDRFAAQSYHRAQAAQHRGDFAREIVPVTLVPEERKGALLTEDEEPTRFDENRMKSLKPAFKHSGTVTAGNASSISDGAAALLLASSDTARAIGLRPIARMVDFVSSAREPQWFTIAPADAITRLLDRNRLEVRDVDLFEINEAFSVSSIAVNRELGLDEDKVNVRGGAVALGHPIGASGARILVTLLYALIDRGKKLGVAALCIGGGEAVAVLVERV